MANGDSSHATVFLPHCSDPSILIKSTFSAGTFCPSECGGKLVEFQRVPLALKEGKQVVMPEGSPALEPPQILEEHFHIQNEGCRCLDVFDPRGPWGS